LLLRWGVGEHGIEGASRRGDVDTEPMTPEVTAVIQRNVYEANQA